MPSSLSISKTSPEEVLAQHGVEAQHPDDFVMNQTALRPFDALEVIKRVRARMKNLARSGVDMIEMFGKEWIPANRPVFEVAH